MAARKMEGADVRVGDCLEVMASLEPSSVDAIVTDPPYGLGFMGKAWDRGVPGSLYWSQALRVIRPGGYLLAFGGTRTYHWLACAIEEGGWELHDTTAFFHDMTATIEAIMSELSPTSRESLAWVLDRLSGTGVLSWLYGSGFPKHKSKLKPAWEPIIVARRPAPKATELNIDACRIETADNLNGGAYSDGAKPRDDRWVTQRAGDANAFRNGGAGEYTPPAGRWPANVVLDEQSASLLDEQSGELTSNSGNLSHRNAVQGSVYGKPVPGPTRGRSDSGGASRFYYCAKASRTERDRGMDGFDAKPLNWSSGTANPRSFQSEGTDKTARNHHPTVKPVSLMRWLCRLVTPAGGMILDPFLGSGSTGIAAVEEGFRFIGIEISDEYAEIAKARIASAVAPGSMDEEAPDLFDADA